MIGAASTVSGGVSVFGWTIPAAVIIAFLLGCYVGRKFL